LAHPFGSAGRHYPWRMGFLRRSASARTATAEVEAISRFWAWWQAEGAEQTALAIADQDPQRMVTALSKQIKAINSGMAWELGPGTENTHVLVISAEGDPQLRGVARRWRRAAPAPDGLWEYSDARLPAADPTEVTLTLGETSVDVASATAWARVSGADLDVAVYHPAFAALDEQERRLATLLLLDTVLGESAMETWVGSVETVTEEPLDPVPLVGLRAVVRELTERFTDATGDPAWVLLEGSTQDGDRVLAGAQIPLRSATAPHLDTHVAVTVPYTDRTPDGLPDHGSLVPLQNFGEHLSSRLGDSGRLVAYETHGGVRILHLYVDGSTPAVEQLRAAVTGWDQGPVTLTAAPDPGWQLVQHLRGR
jgi:hypothetical protein